MRRVLAISVMLALAAPPAAGAEPSPVEELAAALSDGDGPPPSGGAGPPDPPAVSAAPAEPPASERFLAVVREVRIRDTSFAAFPGRRLAFGDAMALETAAGAGEPLRLVVETAFYRPARGGAPAVFGAAGTLDGRVANGAIAWGGDRLAFTEGRIGGARFSYGAEGAQLSARHLDLALSSGRFLAPGGVSVELAKGSKFGVADLAVAPGGAFSGILDLDIAGETGEVRSQGSTLVLTNVHLAGHAITVKESRATGDLAVDFDYALEYPFVVKYPVATLPEKRVALEFKGPMTASLHLQDAGASGDSSVTGTYAFKVPWEPVQTAAFEALSARWVQDVAAVKEVGFEIEPTLFSPCGGACFAAGFRVTVAKREGKKRTFLSQTCEPEGRAELVISKEARSFSLKGVKITPKCKGPLGWVVNLVAPLFTKTYEDITLLAMPAGLPFTIEEVKGGVKMLEISGRVDWQAAKGER